MVRNNGQEPKKEYISIALMLGRALSESAYYPIPASPSPKGPANTAAYFAQ